MLSHHGMNSQIWKEGVEDNLQIIQNKLQVVEQPNAPSTKQPLKTRQDTRLSELEQQLEIAETRCDTLKQQLDYMKMLYHGVNHEPAVLNKPKKPEKEKKETQKRVRSSKTTFHHPSTESSLERKNSPICESEPPERERDCAQPLRLVTDLSLTSTKEEPVALVAENQGTTGASAVQVIQDILCGITDSVNRISQLNVHISDSGNNSKERSQRHHPTARRHHSHSRDEQGRYVAEEQPPMEVPKHSPLINSCSDSNVEHIYQHEFPRVVEEKNFSRKHYKPRSRAGTGKRSVGPQTGSLLNYPVESAESLRVARRKTSKNNHHKRSHNPGPYAQTLNSIARPKRNSEDPIITTKSKKKRIKVKSMSSRSTLGGCKKLACRNSCNNIHLVELYHNTSARPETSPSDENKVYGHNSSQSTFHTMHPHDASNAGTLSEEMITIEKLPSSNHYIEQTEPEQLEQHPCTVKTSVLNQYSFSTVNKKNFEMPTVSSKLKQVEKSYFHRFNFCNIPFVVGKSTTPSHNLGLNIQQALAIIKMRQRTGKMLHMTGEMDSKTRHTVGPYRPFTHASSRHPCPVAASATSYFPNLADLPERDEVVDPVCVEQCEKTLMASTSRFGKLASLVRPHVVDQDLSVGGVLLDPDHQPDNIWTVDQQNEGDSEERTAMRCSCFPTRQCIDYQKLLSQYLESGEGMSFFQVVPQPTVPCYQTPYRPQHLRNSKNEAPNIKDPSEIQDTVNEDTNIDNPYMTQLKSRSRGLKEVLLTLHNDFIRLNSKYNELQTGTNCEGLDEGEVVQQLEVLEAELQTKEDEIAVVMTLYKEVMSLKDQVRALRERTSQQSVNAYLGASVKIQRPRRVVLREPTVSVRLARLLRTIQQFQEKLRQD